MAKIRFVWVKKCVYNTKRSQGKYFFWQMFTKRTSDTITNWFVVFCQYDQGPFWNFVIRGRFKHVMAFGYGAAAQSWVLLDYRLKGCSISVIPAHEAGQLMQKVIGENDAVLLMSAADFKKTRIRWFDCCTTTIRHLIGLEGTLLGVFPDQLYRDMLRAGAVVCVDRIGAPGNPDGHGIHSISKPEP
jgi:hypothetical protein